MTQDDPFVGPDGVLRCRSRRTHARITSDEKVHTMKRQRFERSNSRHRGICLSGIAVLVTIAGSIAEGTQSGLDDGGLGDRASASVAQPKVACEEEALLRTAGVTEGISEAGVCAAAVHATAIQSGAGARARRVAYETARLHAAAKIVQSLGAESIGSPQRLTLHVQANPAPGQIQILDACVRFVPSGEVACGVVALFPASSACDAAPHGRPLKIDELRQSDERILVDMLGVRNGVDEDGRPILIAFGQTDSADEAAGESPALRAKAAATSQLFARCFANELRSLVEVVHCEADAQGVGGEGGTSTGVSIMSRDVFWDGVRERSTAADNVWVGNITTRLDWHWSVERGEGATLSSGGVVEEGWERGVQLLRLLEERRSIRTIRQWSCNDPITGKELHGAIMAITKADLKQFDLESGLRSDETAE